MTKCCKSQFLIAPKKLIFRVIFQAFYVDYIMLA
jgi:hypothetical protein